MATRIPEGAGQAIRILIIDDLIETAQTIRRWLSTVPDLRVVGIATSARAGIEEARRVQPDIILMDIYMPDMDGLAATHVIGLELPTQVILMSVEDSKELVQQAMDVGARGFLVKPLRSDDVLRAIRRVVQMPVPGWTSSDAIKIPRGTQRGQHLVAVCGAKGGVGRSIIAVNLAAALAEFAGEVLLVDGNLQAGDDHILLNLDQSPHSLDMLRTPEDLDLETLHSVTTRHASGLRLLRSPEDPDAAREMSRATMKAILVEAREHFDMTVVDADVAFTEANEAIIEQADRLLIVTTPEITAINRVKSLLDALRRRSIASNKCWLIGNRMDGGYQIAPKRVEQSLGRRFAAQLPDDTHSVISAINRGEPFITLHRRAAITRILYDLAKRLHHDVASERQA